MTATPPLEELLRGPVASAVLRALIRDQTRQMRENGANVPSWLTPVSRALQTAAGEDMTAAGALSATGHAFVKVEVTSWVDVAQAADLAGITERHVRRLAASGQIIARRHGRRAWSIQMESLTNVLRRTAA